MLFEPMGATIIRSEQSGGVGGGRRRRGFWRVFGGTSFEVVGYVDGWDTEPLWYDAFLPIFVDKKGERKRKR